MKTRKILISRTDKTEGLVYEAASVDGDYKLAVELTTITKPVLKLFEKVCVRQLLFKSTNESIIASVLPDQSEIIFLSLEEGPRGRVREASFSLNKTVVEDERGQVLGWIKYRLKKDLIYLGNGNEVGFIKRCSRKGLPIFLLQSKAYLINRFELVHECVPAFDERLIFTFICKLIRSELSEG